MFWSLVVFVDEKGQKVNRTTFKAFTEGDVTVDGRQCSSRCLLSTQSGVHRSTERKRLDHRLNQKLCYV